MTNYIGYEVTPDQKSMTLKFYNLTQSEITITYDWYKFDTSTVIVLNNSEIQSLIGQDVDIVLSTEYYSTKSQFISGQNKGFIYTLNNIQNYSKKVDELYTRFVWSYNSTNNPIARLSSYNNIDITYSNISNPLFAYLVYTATNDVYALGFANVNEDIIHGNYVEVLYINGDLGTVVEHYGTIRELI